MSRKYSVYLMLLFLGSALVGLAEEDKRGIAVAGKDGRPAVAQGDFWLVVIGINNYINFSKLTTAVNDAKEVKNVLVERYGFETRRIVELYDADATAKRILAELRNLSGKIKKDDSLLIYYAGHGNLDEITKSGAWIPVDGAPNDPTTWVDNDVLKKHLTVDAIKARHILLISDSCFAGDFFAGRSGTAPKITDAYVQMAFGKTSREALTSGGVEPVSDKGFANHSVFAHFLLTTLKENAESYLLPSAIHERVKGGVSQNARQQTLYGPLTGTGTELGGSFVLFLKGATGGLDEMVREKTERISMLNQAEAELKARAEAEAAEVRAREEKIAELDGQIAALQKKLGVVGKGDTGTLDQIVAVVDQKERQARELEDMRQRAEAERRQREAEIARLKEEENNKRSDALQTDIAKYEKVAQSQYGQDLKDSAWNALLEKWGLQKGSIAVGNTSALYKTLNIETFADFLEKQKAALYKTLNLSTPAPTGFVAVGTNPQGYNEYRHEQTGMVFVLIPAGQFQMGSNDGRSDEKPVHSVTVSGFLIGKYEVTQGEWQKVMGYNPSNFKEGDNYPVEQVSWYDCQSFCRKAGLRLPTEAEWEYACRAGTNTKYYWGNTEDGRNYMWYCDFYDFNDGRERTTHPVGEKKPNGFGLYDILGNVCEWCQDWYGPYSSGIINNPRGPGSGQDRVLRGGSWIHGAFACRSCERGCGEPPNRSSIGFRCVVLE